MFRGNGTKPRRFDVLVQRIKCNLRPARKCGSATRSCHLLYVHVETFPYNEKDKDGVQARLLSQFYGTGQRTDFSRCSWTHWCSQAVTTNRLSDKLS